VGHTKVRCKEPLVEEDAGDNGGGDMGNHGGDGIGSHSHGGQDDFGSAPAGNDGWS